MSALTDTLLSGIGNTPVRSAAVRYRGRVHQILLKCEQHNPTGSIKDRTAAGLLLAIDKMAPLVPGTVVVESTSGNLGLSLAHLLSRVGGHLVAVVDPFLPQATRERLEKAGATLHCVRNLDGFGGYLLSRLAAVEELCRAHPSYRWTNQYGNPANPAIHRDTIGPEIVAQVGSSIDAVYVAVSTGGTLAGVSSYLRSCGRPVRIVAVDAEGSLVTGSQPGRRLVAGLGASRPSEFLSAGSYTHAIRVPAAQAISVCRMMRAGTGFCLGGSSGSVVAACLSQVAGPAAPQSPLCICADDGSKYEDTVYDDAWLVAMNLGSAVDRATEQFRADGLVFERVRPWA